MGVTNQLMEILVHLPDYRANIHNKIEAIRAGGSAGLSKATATVDVLNKELSAAADTAANKKLNQKGGREPIAVQVAVPPRNTAEYLRDAAGPLTGILETAGIVVIFTLFILVKREDLRNRLFRLAGRHQLRVMTQALDEASQRLGRYLLLQFVVNVGYGLLFGLGVDFIGIPHPLVWGVLVSLLCFVPYIGTPVAAAFPIGIRDEADEIVAMMIMQLLRRAGHNAEALPIGAVSSMVEQVERLYAEVICISALPPFATSQAKSLCKRLRQRCPEAKIVLGLWEFPGGVTKAQERVGSSCANVIGTSLAQVTSLIGAKNLLAC